MDYRLQLALLLVACPGKQRDTTSSSSTGATSTTDTPTGTDSTSSSPLTASDIASTSAADTASTPATATGAATDTGGTGIPQAGENPCGSCPNGTFCHYQPGDSPECSDIGCESIDSTVCLECFSDPANCDIADNMNCFSFICYDGILFEGVEIADDGIVVVRCDEYGDTDCTI